MFLYPNMNICLTLCVIMWNTGLTIRSIGAILKVLDCDFTIKNRPWHKFLGLKNTALYQNIWLGLTKISMWFLWLNVIHTSLYNQCNCAKMFWNYKIYTILKISHYIWIILEKYILKKSIKMWTNYMSIRTFLHLVTCTLIKHT